MTTPRPGRPRDREALAAGMASLNEAAELGLAHAIDATAAAYRALHSFEAVPTRRGCAQAHLLIGQLAMYADELAEARDHLTRARDLFAEVGIAIGGWQARSGLGQLLTRLGDLEGAGIEYGAAARLARESGSRHAQAAAERYLGSWARRSGRASEAMEHYTRAAELFERLGDDAGLASVHLSVGNLALSLGRLGAAMEAYATAVRGFRAVGDPLGEANAERFYADAARAAGDTSGAREHYARALALYTDLDERLGQSHVRHSLGELAAESADPDLAREHLAAAIDLFTTTGEVLSLVNAVDALAATYRAEGDMLGALRHLCLGVTQARQAARWAVAPARQEKYTAAIAGLESRALEMAVDLGEPMAAGQVIEGGVAGLVGLLPALLSSPPSPDPKTERLRQQVRDLARRLDSAGGTDTPTEEPKGDEDRGDGEVATRSASSTSATATPTRGDRDARRADVIAELETLLGPRAKEVVAPAAIDYPAVIEAIRTQGAVMQYSAPGGIVGGQPLYIVWATPDHPPRLVRTTLSEPVAERLTLLAGGHLLAETGPGEAGAAAVPAEVSEARGLGLDLAAGDAAALSQAQAVARRTSHLWAALDRDPRAEAVVRDTAAALFPRDLAEWLAGAVDRVSGIPARLLIVPGPSLWNLPWAGLVAAEDGRRLVDLARVSLAPCLSCMSAWGTGGGRGRDGGGTRRATAWIPADGSATVLGTGVERAMVGAVFGREALAATPARFLADLASVDAAIASVHGNAGVGLSHGVYLTADVCLSAADLIALDLPDMLIIGACWSARVDAQGEPFALPLIAHARGAGHIIGGVYPLPDAPPFPTSRLLTQLYPALLGTDPATALWLAQHEAHEAHAAPHTWAGVTHSTVRMWAGEIPR